MTNEERRPRQGGDSAERHYDEHNDTPSVPVATSATTGRGVVAGLAVPELPEPEMSDPLGGALRWANAGWYVGPIDSDHPKGKHAGNVLKQGWPEKTTRDAEVIGLWFAGTAHQPFVHVGRSGGIVFDLDNPEQTPDVLRRAILECAPPFQTTRTTEGLTEAEVVAAFERFELRGHVFFAVPPGRTLGNGLGKLPKGWGEIRGKNGIVVVDPARHSKASDGGAYRVHRCGPVPVLPDYVAELLPDASDSAGLATDAEVASAMAAWTGSAATRALSVLERRWDTDVRGSGASRHDTLTVVLPWAARDARAGLYPLRGGVKALWDLWMEDTALPLGGGTDRRPAEAASEFSLMLSWAVQCALDESDEAIAQRALRADPEARAAADVERLSAGLAGVAAPADFVATGAGGGDMTALLKRPADTYGTPPEGMTWDPRNPGLDYVTTEHAAQIVAQVKADRVGALRARFLTTKQVRDLPPPEPIVAGLLHRNSLSTIFGPSGSLKSFVALDLGCRIALGLPWAGRTVRQGKVAYIVAEGAGGFAKRVEAWEEHNGRGVDGLMILPEPLQVTSPEWGVLVELAEEERWDLVILDTRHRVSVGLDENDSGDGARLVQYCEALRDASGGCVMLVHHTGHEGTRERGSSSVPAALDSEFSLAATRKGGVVRTTLKATKVKDDANGDAFTFEAQVFDLGRWDDLGRPVTSLVLEHVTDTVDEAQDPEERPFDGITYTDCDMALVAVLEDLTSQQHGGLTKAGLVGFLGKGKGRHPSVRGEGFGKSTVYKRIKLLHERGEIARVDGKEQYVLLSTEARAKAVARWRQRHSEGVSLGVSPAAERESDR